MTPQKAQMSAEATPEEIASELFEYLYEHVEAPSFVHEGDNWKRNVKKKIATAISEARAERIVLPNYREVDVDDRKECQDFTEGFNSALDELIKLNPQLSGEDIGEKL